MELIIFGLGCSLGTVLFHLLEVISQRLGHASSAVASTQTTKHTDAGLQITPQAAAFRQRLRDQKHVTTSERCHRGLLTDRGPRVRIYRGG